MYVIVFTYLSVSVVVQLAYRGSYDIKVIPWIQFLFDRSSDS